MCRPMGGTFFTQKKAGHSPAFIFIIWVYDAPAISLSRLAGDNLWP